MVQTPDEPARYVSLEVSDGVGVITLQRPPMNALSIEVQEQFARAAREAGLHRVFEFADVETAAACVVGAMTEAVISPIAPTTPTTHDKHRVATTIADFCVRAVCR